LQSVPLCNLCCSGLRGLRGLRGLALSLDPSLRGDGADLGDEHLGQAREHVAQVGERIESPPAAALDDTVEGNL